MLSTAARLAAALVNDLPPEVRKSLDAHFLDGKASFKIQRWHKLKRRDLEAMSEADRVYGAWLCTIAAKGCVTPCSWTPQESQVERCEHQDDSNIHCQPFPECQCRHKTPAILPVLPMRDTVSLGGDAVGTLQ